MSWRFIALAFAAFLALGIVGALLFRPSSERDRIADRLEEMRRAGEALDPMKAAHLFSKDFEADGKSRDEWLAWATTEIDDAGKLRITFSDRQYEFPEPGRAIVTWRWSGDYTPKAGTSDAVLAGEARIPFGTFRDPRRARAEFVLEEGQWRLRTITPEMQRPGLQQR